MRNTLFLLLSVLFFGSCDSVAPKKQAAVPQYFDLKGFMDKEVQRLKTLNPEINKTVMVNNTAEDKKLKIADWQKELSAFTDADINKSAWEGLFTRHKNATAEIYKSDNDKVPVKSLTVQYRDHKIFKIQILNSNSNSLYTSNDTLSYFPDSLYEVRKTQHIKLLNVKSYRITGKFN
ncbi:MAG: hypothetical protein ABWY16_10665 [Pedobacter sp.]|jgi:hypothetical protein|uniref:hypothetical protein n=1 Tax=Pedobacter sp. TaxID=1411316 RepID=UPI003390A194